MTYFNELPLVNYNDKLSKNIILQAAIARKVLDQVDAFYPYIVKEGYRPDMVADEEYGNPYYDWLVYMSNSITDPYYLWPMDNRSFKGYLESKYNTDIYTLQSQILHYKYTGLTNETPEQVSMITWTMTPKTHEVLSAEDPESVSGWSPVYTFDYEDQLNESRRSIRLISKIYLPQIEKEIKKVFK